MKNKKNRYEVEEMRKGYRLYICEAGVSTLQPTHWPLGFVYEEHEETKSSNVATEKVTVQSK